LITKTFYAQVIAVSLTGVVNFLFLDEEILHPVHFAFTIYLISGVLFFHSLGWMVFTMLRILRQSEHIDLIRWRSFYDLIYDVIDEMNKSFGPFVLVALISIFIWLINSSFFILVSLRENGINLNIMIFIFLDVIAFTLFFFVVYVPHRIRKEVN